MVHKMVQVTNNSNAIPAMRISMCADYYLTGSAPESSVGTDCNIYFTSTQYQQMIIDLITVATSSGSTFTVSTTTNSNYSTGGNQFCCFSYYFIFPVRFYSSHKPLQL